MTTPNREPEVTDPFDADSAQARDTALERLAMDYPVEFDRLPDLLLAGDSSDD